MITEKNFKKNIKDILNDGNIEGIPLHQLDMLKDIYGDDNLIHLFFLEFENNYPCEYNGEMLFTKTQDFIYRLDMAINDWLIPKHKLKTIDEIKSTLLDLIFENIDLYSSVDYNEFDKDLIEEFESVFPSKDIMM